MSRPSKYSLQRVQRVCSALMDGNTRAAAAAYAGIGERTFYDWMGQFPQFSQAVHEAEAVAECGAVQSIQRAGLPHQVERIKTVVGEDGRVIREERTFTEAWDWKAAAWWLTRRRHEEYGEHERLPAVPTNLTVNVSPEPALLRVYGNAANPTPSVPSDDVIEASMIEGG